MPFIAKRKDTGERIDITTIEEPRATISSGDCICQLCGQPLVVKGQHLRQQGITVRAHFAHYGDCDSPFEAHPESAEHRFAKVYMRDILRDLYRKYADVKIDLEVPIAMPWRAKGRQADLMVCWPAGWREVHEIQLAAITPEKLEERTNDYLRSGIDVTWWFGKNANTQGNVNWCINRFGEALFIDFTGTS